MNTSDRAQLSPNVALANSATQVEALREWASQGMESLKAGLLSPGMSQRTIDRRATTIWRDLARYALALLPESESHPYRYDEFIPAGQNKTVSAHVLSLLERASFLGRPAAPAAAGADSGQNREPTVEDPSEVASAGRGEKRREGSEGVEKSQALMRVLNVFTDGVADTRIETASRLLSDDALTADEKLTRIDELIRFPATASAEQLGVMLGVTKQAVLKTEWWRQNRQGEKQNEVGRRRAGHQRRAEEHESTNDGDER
jgi:hypothetical protein